MKRNAAIAPPRRMGGITLIELMIALVLGLLVVGVAVTIFASNRQTYRATENLGWVQENVRTAFELMGRDVREASGNPCVKLLPIANVLNPPGGATGTGWWADIQNWNAAIRGYRSNEAFAGGGFGTTAGARLNGTEAVELTSGDDTVVTIRAHNTGSAQFTLNTANHGFTAGDVLLVCNSRQAAIFQASAVSGTTVSHGTSGTPGNCTTQLGLVGLGEACSTREAFEFAAPNSVIVKMHATRWYIANNGNGNPALYQSRLAGGVVSNEEVAEGVSGMQLAYLRENGNDYETAAVINGRWDQVIAVRISLTVESAENVGVDQAPITRPVFYVATLRNRNP